MAHVEKYKASALGHMLAHYNRSTPANKDIDRSRTEQNYNLAPERGDLLNFINARLADGVKVQQRADVIKLCDWVVTMPKDLPGEKEQAFFANTYDFLVNKYGEKNMVSAYVHKDESTPHMHFAWLPIVKEKKNKKRLGQEKLSAKECITRSDLQKFHQQLQDYLEQKLNCQVKILNEATKDGNKSIADLKRHSQQTETTMSWLASMEKDAERTKMGRGGLYGEPAIKVPEPLFNALVTIARRGIADNANVKALKNKRDENAKAQARADELAHQLRAEQDKRRIVELELEKERKRARISSQADACRLVSRVMDSGMTTDDIEIGSYVKTVASINAIKNATADIKTIGDGIRYKLKLYYDVNHNLDNDDALKVAIKAYYTYNGTKLDKVDDAIRAVGNVLPTMWCTDNSYRLQLQKKIRTYAQNMEQGIRVEIRKAEIKEEVKQEKQRKKLIITPNQSKDQGMSR